MDTTACRKLLNAAWVGITSHMTHWTVDYQPFGAMDDEELLDWMNAITSGRLNLSYYIRDDFVSPSLMD